MTIITEYNDKEITDEQLEALAASLLAQMIEYYKNVSEVINILRFIAIILHLCYQQAINYNLCKFTIVIP